MSLSEILSKIFSAFKKLFGSSNTKTTDNTVHTKRVKSARETDKKENEYLYETNTPVNRSEADAWTEDILTVDEMVDHLISVESYTIHYNKGERGKTAPAGIYYKHFADWEGWRFLTHVAQENSIDFDPAVSNSVGCKALTELIRTEYKAKMDDLIADFVRKEYFDKLHPEFFPGKKSALSFFSLTVHAGRRRAAKLLQKVLVQNGANIAVDGMAGSKTFAALQESGLDDDYLNQQLLLQMYFFYNRLVARNPAKYSRFYKGWVNRLKSLGFYEPEA